MSIKRNSRQIPKESELVANKDYSDLVYSWFQANSTFVGEDRYVEKSYATATRIAKDIGISRQTVKKKVDNLIFLGLLSFDEKNKRYVLPLLSDDKAWLVENDALKKMIESKVGYCVSVYVYFAKRFFASGGKEYITTYTQIKEFLGICSTTRSNDSVVKNCFNVLEENGLIEYKIRHEGAKSLMFITKVNDCLRQEC